MTNDELRRMESLREIIFKLTEYIHSTFDVGRSSVSFSIKLVAIQASGWTEPGTDYLGINCPG